MLALMELPLPAIFFPPLLFLIGASLGTARHKGLLNI